MGLIKSIIFAARASEKETRRQELILKLWEAYDLADDDDATQSLIVLLISRIVG